MSINQLSGVSGMSISLARESRTSVAERVCAAVLDVLLCSLLLFPMVWSVVSAYALPVDFTVVALVLGLCIAAFAVLFRARRRGPVIAAAAFFAVLLVLAGLFVYYNFGDISDGFVILTNHIFGVWTQNGPYSMPVYITEAPAVLHGRLCTLILSLLAIPVAALACHAIVRCKSAVYTLTVALPFYLLAMFFTGVEPLPTLIAPLCVLSSLLFMRLSGRARSFSHKRPLLPGSRASASAGGLAALALTALCFGAVQAVAPEADYVHGVDSAALQQNAVNALLKIPLLSRISVSFTGGSDEIRLDSGSPLMRTGATVLRVYTSDGEPLYLKGNVGTEYTGRSWETLPPEIYDGMESQLAEYWRASGEGDGDSPGYSVHNFYSSLMGSGFGSRYLAPGDEIEVSVENIGANRSRIYAPYNLITRPENISGVRYVQDLHLRADDYRGISRYSVSAYGSASIPTFISFEGGVSGLIGDDLASVLDPASAYYGDAQVQAFSSMLQTLTPDMMRGFYGAPIDNLSRSAWGDSFKRAEADYRRYMYYANTNLPAGVKQSVTAVLRDAGILGAEYRSVGEIARAVKDYLSRGFEYTLDPGPLPGGADYVEHFLTQSKKGYCMHFASAATVMLRAMGVPARYADGFIVTRDDYGDDGWANVTDHRAHAWVEVYYHGAGWQPLEVTPGFSQAAATAVDNQPAAPEHTPYDFEEYNNNDELDSMLHGDASSGITPAAPQEHASGGGPWGFIVAAAVAIALAVAVIAVRRKAVLHIRRRRFTDAEHGRAVVRMYKFMHRLTKYGAAHSQRIKECAERACFSRDGVGGGEQRECLSLVDAMAQACYARQSRPKRIIYKYVMNIV